MLEQVIRKKRGVSVVVGYVLLVSLSVVMGVALFVWMKSYVPQEKLNCPEGTSISIVNYTYMCGTNSTLSIGIRNNGKFSAGGYLIRASNEANVTLATIDLSLMFVNTIQSTPPIFGGAVLLSPLGENTFEPGENSVNIFDLDSISGNITFIEIIPIRWQEEKGVKKINFVSFGDASSYKEKISCS